MLGLGHRPHGRLLQSLPPGLALGLAGVQGPQPFLAPAHHGINILEKEKGSSRGSAIEVESRAEREGPKTWMVTSTLQPQARPSRLV